MSRSHFSRGVETTLLSALIVLPALAVVPGTIDGRILYVLYREPKQALFVGLGWAFVAAWAWHRRDIDPTSWRLDRQSAPSAPLVLFAALLAWMTLTRAWSLVPANHLGELHQWTLLFVLVLTLAAGEPSDHQARRLRHGLVASLALVTAVGLFQTVVELRWLAPIDVDRYGVRHPSTFGYKNPAALAVVGQLFLLAGLAFDARSRRWRWLWTTLLGIEIVYLASLQSRTAWMACVVGSFAFLVLATLIRGRRAGASAWLGLTLLIAAVAVVPTTRERAASALTHLDPTTYLASDRGIYLRNTLAMVEHNPLGVGLGDWQTAYPIYREVGRDLGFDGLHQVRRAHSDHVQILGELGWPGFALWLALIGSVAWIGVAASLRERSMPLAAATVQWLATNAAMATDYVTEMPYHRLQWGLVMALILIGSRGGSAATERKKAGSRRPLLGTGLAIGLIAVAAIETVQSVMLVRGARIEAEIQRTYLAAEAADRPAVRRALLEQIVRDGRRLRQTPFHTKTRFRAELAVAEAESLIGLRRKAMVSCRAALELYPYDPLAMRLMARLLAEWDPISAATWRRAAEIVEIEAISGFPDAYPQFPDMEAR